MLQPLAVTSGADHYAHCKCAVCAIGATVAHPLQSQVGGETIYNAMEINNLDVDESTERCSFAFALPAQTRCTLAHGTRLHLSMD